MAVVVRVTVRVTYYDGNGVSYDLNRGDGRRKHDRRHKNEQDILDNSSDVESQGTQSPDRQQDCQVEQQSQKGIAQENYHVRKASKEIGHPQGRSERDFGGQ